MYLNGDEKRALELLIDSIVENGAYSTYTIYNKLAEIAGEAARAAQDATLDGFCDMTKRKARTGGEE